MQQIFCIILPMCQFAYFVGKMTHRPDARRQNEPASRQNLAEHWDLANIGIFYSKDVVTEKTSLLKQGN
jgi:hypothetical protein